MALRLYVANRGYLRACCEGAPRIGLDGMAAGVVSAAEAANSAERLKAQTARRKKQTQPVKAASPAQPKRLSLADLRQAAQARRQVVQQMVEV
jgi:ProP effector